MGPDAECGEFTNVTSAFKSCVRRLYNPDILSCFSNIRPDVRKLWRAKIRGPLFKVVDVAMFQGEFPTHSSEHVCLMYVLVFLYIVVTRILSSIR